jgi:uncharacterized protein (TIGR04222 family)
VNPFDLHGPEFLAFYIFFALAILSMLYLSRRLGDTGEIARPPMDDPYFVACLRGGEKECTRVATLALIDRGLLTVKSSGTSILTGAAMGENRLEVTDPQAISNVKRPIEKEILEAFRTPSLVNSTLDALQYSSACQDYARRLEQLGLVHKQEVRDKFPYRIWVAVALFLGVAVIKIFIALSRGRTNVLFLIVLAIAACFVATRINSPFRTASGEKFLESVRSLFSNLRLRAPMLRPGGGSSDLTWLAAAFGLSAVPTLVFPHVSMLIARPGGTASNSGFSFFNNSNNSCGTSSCGGGCGS